MTLCRFDGCEHQSAPGGLCWGHWKQKQRGQQLSPLRPRGRTRRAVFQDAAVNFTDAMPPLTQTHDPSPTQLWLLEVEPTSTPTYNHSECKAALQRAAFCFGDASSEDEQDFKRAWARLRMAARRYVRAGCATR